MEARAKYGRTAGASAGTVMLARAVRGCAAETVPAARSTTHPGAGGPSITAADIVTGRRPRAATTMRTSTV
jgi:hypothetical protein